MSQAFSIYIQNHLVSWTHYMAPITDLCARMPNQSNKDFLLNSIVLSSALTGTMLAEYGMGKRMPPATWIYAPKEVDHLFFDRDQAKGFTLATALMHSTVYVRTLAVNEPDWGKVTGAQENAIGSAFFPRLSGDPAYRPSEWVPRYIPELIDPTRMISEKFNQTSEETCLSLALVTGTYIASSGDYIPLDQSLLLAAEIIKGFSYLTPWSKPEQLSHEMSFDPKGAEIITPVRVQMPIPLPSSLKRVLS